MKNRSSYVTKAASMLLAFMLCISCSGCGEASVSQSEIRAMDSVMTITAYGKKAGNAISAAESVITAIDAALDPEIESSYVYAINHANGASVVIPGQIANMITTAQTISSRGSGALDLTIYPLVKLWGFVNNRFYVPTDVEILSGLDKLCFKDVIVTKLPSTGTYTVSMPATGQITFASMARGCASQNAIEAMRQSGVESAIISLDGNVQTLGLKPDGTNWNVAVKDPNNPVTYLGVLNVGETAVSTSAKYLSTFTDINGDTYHHIINPTSGYPTTNTLLSATVICEDGVMADALSTAMYVLGQSRALSYWRNYGGFEMVLVNSAGEITCTSGLIEHFTLTNTDDYTVAYTE